MRFLFLLLLLRMHFPYFTKSQSKFHAESLHQLDHLSPLLESEHIDSIQDGIRERKRREIIRASLRRRKHAEDVPLRRHSRSDSTSDDGFVLASINGLPVDVSKLSASGIGTPAKGTVGGRSDDLSGQLVAKDAAGNVAASMAELQMPGSGVKGPVYELVGAGIKLQQPQTPRPAAGESKLTNTSSVGEVLVNIQHDKPRPRKKLRHWCDLAGVWINDEGSLLLTLGFPSADKTLISGYLSQVSVDMSPKDTGERRRRKARHTHAFSARYQRAAVRVASARAVAAHAAAPASLAADAPSAGVAFAAPGASASSVKNSGILGDHMARLVKRSALETYPAAPAPIAPGAQLPAANTAAQPAIPPSPGAPPPVAPPAAAAAAPVAAPPAAEAAAPAAAPGAVPPAAAGAAPAAAPAAAPPTAAAAAPVAAPGAVPPAAAGAAPAAAPAAAPPAAAAASPVAAPGAAAPAAVAPGAPPAAAPGAAPLPAAAPGAAPPPPAAAPGAAPPAAARRRRSQDASDAPSNKTDTTTTPKPRPHFPPPGIGTSGIPASLTNRTALQGSSVTRAGPFAVVTRHSGSSVGSMVGQCQQCGGLDTIVAQFFAVSEVYTCIDAMWNRKAIHLMFRKWGERHKQRREHQPEMLETEVVIKQRDRGTNRKPPPPPPPPPTEHDKVKLTESITSNLRR